jgi:hypothetical protein
MDNLATSFSDKKFLSSINLLTSTIDTTLLSLNYFLIQKRDMFHESCISYRIYLSKKEGKIFRLIIDLNMNLDEYEIIKLYGDELDSILQKLQLVESYNGSINNIKEIYKEYKFQYLYEMLKYK